MEPLTLADGGRHKTDDGYEYELSRVPDEIDALGLAKLIGPSFDGVEVSHPGGTATIVVTGLGDDARADFERSLRAMLDEVNTAHAVAERVSSEGESWTPEDQARGPEDEAAVKQSFDDLD